VEAEFSRWKREKPARTPPLTALGTLAAENEIL
jgi:hypothetical protein